MHLLAYDYYADRPAPHLGLERAAALIDVLRAEVDNSVLFDNGDFLQGSPLGEQSSPNDSPVIGIMNAMGYDAAALGNHEFNFGLDAIHALCAKANFPVLSANIAIAANGKTTPIVQPWTIITHSIRTDHGTEDTIKIGVIGLTPPQIVKWDQSHLPDNLITFDMVEAAQRYVPDIKAAGAEVIIALSHTGIGDTVHDTGMENAAVPVAAIPGIDALIAGHTHMVFPIRDQPSAGPVNPALGLVHDKPCVMVGAYGSHVGAIDLSLEKTPTGWRVKGPSFVQVRPVKPDAQPAKKPAPVFRALDALHGRTLAYIRRPIGQTTAPLHSYFALARPSDCLSIVTNAIRAHASTLNLPDIPVLVSATTYRAGGRAGASNYIDIPAGALTMRNAAELYPHSNKACVIEITGSQLKDWLEKSAEIFAPLTARTVDQPLLRLDVPSYCFDEVNGVTYNINPTKPLGHRISNLRWKGRGVPGDMRFALVTNSYRVGGGGDFPHAATAQILATPKTAIRDMVIEHIRSVGTLRPGKAHRWRLNGPRGGIAALLESGSGALAHLHTVPHGQIIDHGPAIDGFRNFQVKL